MTQKRYTDNLDPQWIAQKLLIPTTLTHASQSTQLDAKEAIQKNTLAPHLFLANQQSAAKGRFSRPFFTKEDGGIYMSLYLDAQTSQQDPATYTLMVASSIVKAIEHLTGIKTAIKWVNDIYLNDKKIAGILTESLVEPETGEVYALIIGVGINFFIPNLPSPLSQKATSLFSAPPKISRNQLIVEIWRLFFKTPYHDLLKVYKDKSLVLGRTVSFHQNKKDYQGKAIDITPFGSLVVQLDDHNITYLSSGEISLSSW
ncbi:biotin--[acetyl-CoA-carboxylase] ligase [Streptococcus sp. zg-JUN1979]|uniref:biotin--[acetyl-CoA-carboxylase] ligase n=1 Tax=Streptococcus sp. zg-JUN1979 TaxID=3391450 RepID=UPI0039A51CCF